MTTGRYSRVREIGRGSTGAVWLGTDEVLGRSVALKRVGVVPGGVEPDFARAEREARLAAALNHPHVVAVFDLVTEGEDQWLVMEYVDGTSLADLVRQQGALTADRAASVLEQTADALAAAHAAGIVHRDVKPSNILITPGGQAKLTDFGIARAEADATLTQTGLVTGSPAYLSPEVASGRTATSASDVWALGATLFHCLAGHPPYEVGDNVLGAMYRIVHEPPPRVDDAGWLGPVLEHTMATAPEDRWPMHQVRDFLREGGAPGSTQVLPAAAPAEDATLVDEEVDDDPAAAHPPVPEAAPGAPPAASAPASEERGRWPWAVLALAVAALSVIAFVVGMNRGDDNDPAEAEPAGSTPSESATTEAPEPEPEAEADPEAESESGDPTPTEEAEPESLTPEEMEAFVTTYLDTVTEDPRATWRMLTPEFQAESRNFGSYRGFWSTVADARVSEVRPDPDSSTVTYDVTYEMEDGAVRTDSPTLQLVRQEGMIKIAGES